MFPDARDLATSTLPKAAVCISVCVSVPSHVICFLDVWEPKGLPRVQAGQRPAEGSAVHTAFSGITVHVEWTHIRI